MDLLEFYCHDLVELRPATGAFLFNQPKHLFLQSKKGWRVYGLRHKQTKKVFAQIFFNIKGKRMFSPFRAPFGSLEIYGRVGQKKVAELFSKVEEDARGLGIEYLQITNYPEAYDPFATRLIQKSLARLNFKCILEVSSIIPVDHKIFERRIAISQRQKLRKSEKRFIFSQVKLTELKNIYNFIGTCRKEKGQILSMAFARLQKTASFLPKSFILFQVANEEQIAAAAIVIKVSEKILYTFYYSHDRKFDKISPVVFLISGIYKYAQEHHFTLIDLGTSMVSLGVNRSLMHFKNSIGGEPSDKFIFEKTFS